MRTIFTPPALRRLLGRARQPAGAGGDPCRYREPGHRRRPLPRRPRRLRALSQRGRRPAARLRHPDAHGQLRPGHRVLHRRLRLRLQDRRAAHRGGCLAGLDRRGDDRRDAGLSARPRGPLRPRDAGRRSAGRARQPAAYQRVPLRGPARVGDGAHGRGQPLSRHPLRAHARALRTGSAARRRRLDAVRQRRQRRPPQGRRLARLLCARRSRPSWPAASRRSSSCACPTTTSACRGACRDRAHHRLRAARRAGADPARPLQHDTETRGDTRRQHHAQALVSRPLPDTLDLPRHVRRRRPRLGIHRPAGVHPEVVGGHHQHPHRHRPHRDDVSAARQGADTRSSATSSATTRSSGSRWCRTGSSARS